MTVSTTAYSTTATGNGSTTSFPFTFAARSAADVTVTINGVTVFAYTITLAADHNSGTVNFITPPPNGAAVVIASSPAFTQSATFVNAGAYNPSAVDAVNDTAAIRDIYLKGQIISAAQASANALANEASLRAQGDAAIAGSLGSTPTNVSLNASSRSLLAALNTSSSFPAILTEPGREGIFAWSAANNQTNVTNDPGQGIYVPPTAGNGSTGAWVRKFPTVINTKWFGAVGDAAKVAGSYVGTENSTAIMNAVAFAALRGGGRVFTPAGTYLVDGSYINVPHGVIVEGEGTVATIFVSNKAGGGGANAFENLRNGSTFTSINGLNGSTSAQVGFRDFGIINTNAANQGAGIFERGGTYIEMDGVEIQGHRFGGAYSQTELILRTNCRFEGQVNNGAGEWMINGNDLGDGAAVGYTNNVISVRCQYNQGLATIPCLVHDGGYNYTSINDNFNGGLYGLRLAGITTATLISPASESTTQGNMVLSATGYYSSAGVGSCSVCISGGSLSAPAAAYGAILINAAGYVSLGGGVELSTPTGASVRGSVNASVIEVGSVQVAYAPGDPLLDGWPTQRLMPATYMGAIPTSGYYRAGQVIFPQSWSSSVLFWRCTASGSPGTWEIIAPPGFNVPVGGQLVFSDASGPTFQSYVEQVNATPVAWHSIVSQGGNGGWYGGVRVQLNYNAGALFDALKVKATGAAAATADIATAYLVAGTQVLAARQTGTPAAATDLASVITLANFLRTSGLAHGSIG